MATKKKATKPRIQFSKIIAVAALVLGWTGYCFARAAIGEQADDQLSAFRAILEYTFGVVAVYNGNSVSEKYFTSKHLLFGTEKDGKEEAWG